MISKNDLRDTIVNDIKIIKQLAAKVPESGLEYRFTPEQRSTLELLQYLTIMPSGVMQAAQDGNFGWFGPSFERVAGLASAELPAAFDKTMEDVQQRFDAISEEDFANGEVDVEGMGAYSLRGWLLGTASKFTTAYKMQLFLQAKAAGGGGLDTFDVWMDNGEIERPQPVPQETAQET